jgi:hypothetical protein
LFPPANVCSWLLFTLHNTTRKMYIKQKNVMVWKLKERQESDWIRGKYYFALVHRK